MPEQTTAAGRAADRRGNDWQRRAATWPDFLQWFPSAQHVGRRWNSQGGHGDITGVGDRVIECTVAPWGEIPAKLRQAEHDAAELGFGEWSVWKPARNAPVGDSFVLHRARVIWPLLARLDNLEAERFELVAERDEAALRAEEAWHRGYEAALKAHNLPYLVKGEVR